MAKMKVMAVLLIVVGFGKYIWPICGTLFWPTLTN